MTRILVQRGSTGSSSLNLSRSSSLPGPSAFSTHQVPSAAKDGEVNEEVSELVASDEHLECSRSSENKGVKDDPLVENLRNDRNGTSSDAIAEAEKVNTLAALGSCDMMNDSGEKVASETEGSSGDPSPIGSRRSPNPVRAGSSRRAVAWPIVSTRTSPSESWPSSPRSHGENEGYNSADEQSPCFVSSYGDAERERQFEIDIRLAKGLEVKRMLEDGNCLFRAVADQERERDHFSQFITEGFTSYCKRKRRDKVYGSNVEIQALSEMYNRPIHIYSYSIGDILD
ncbi:hypothetical protein GOBAR_DD05787 [Gossypium barbadense]|nr:hypothetical protein GOBAR_DD05787 [Gossypium barbadense]